MRRVAPLLALGLLTGCESVLEQRSDDLGEARARWERQGIDDYRYDVRSVCFCQWEATVPFTITVVNGVTSSIVWADSGGAAPPQYSDGRQTVDQLFDFIAGLIARKPVVLNVVYDEDLGFPVSIRLDEDRKMADDELLVTVANFQPLP